MKKNHQNQQSGFGLLEVLLASAILAIMVGGAAVLGIMLLRTNVGGA